MLFNQYFRKKKIDKLLKTITFLKDITYFRENGLKNDYLILNGKLTLDDFKLSSK